MLVLVLPKKRLIMMLRAMDAQMMVMMNVAMITTMAAAAGQSDVHEDEAKDQYTDEATRRSENCTCVRSEDVQG